LPPALPTGTGAAWTSADGQMILSTGRSTTSRNASATLAFHQHRQALQEEGDEGPRSSNVKIVIEPVDSKFRVRLTVESIRGLSIPGPTRDSRPEAIKDGAELGRVFVAEGAVATRRAVQRLEQRRWTPKEIETADERDLEGFVYTAGQQGGASQPKLIPPGEGWVRHDEELLVNPQSQVFFAQVGWRRGHYYKRHPTNQKLEDATVPHTPIEHPISASAASASCVRKGTKLDRAVLLNDITKIARLALKFPLSFVDQPACAYALFQGLRSADAAQWCAENFHKKLLPLIAEKIHTYERHELQEVLSRTLEALDAEILKSSQAFSGCSALLALLLGDKLVVAGVGRVRAVLLPDKGPPKQLLACTGDPADPKELERLEGVGTLVREGVIHPSAEGFDDASRILAARHAFEVLQIEPGGPADEKQVRSAYRRLALRVHPDKQGDAAELDACKRAFARLEGAKETIEAMLSEDAEGCREAHRVLRSDVHARAGAAALLGTSPAAALDTAAVTAEAETASKALVKRLGKLQKASLEHHDMAVAACHEAVATLRRGCTEEALPRQEALLREGLSTSRTMGARDLRYPHPVVLMQPETASQWIPLTGRFRVALLCGAASALPEEQLARSTAHLVRQPKASALRWCLDADASVASSSAVCLAVNAAQSDEAPAKRPRTAASGAGPEGTVRVRHILLRHQQLRQPDPLARREGAARGAQEAEAAALGALEQLLKDANQFPRLCRELSDCQTGAQPGKLAGDLGWLARGQQEQSFEDVAFALPVNAFGDIVSSSRGVHIIQRLA